MSFYHPIFIPRKHLPAIIRTPPFLKEGGGGGAGGWTFLKLAKRGGFNFDLIRERIEKRGWDGVIRMKRGVGGRGGGIKKIYKTFSISIKETQTFKAY